ncbi:hypothetical protein D9M71_198450 [compost metagenome]
MYQCQLATPDSPLSPWERARVRESQRQTFVGAAHGREWRVSPALLVGASLLAISESPASTEQPVGSNDRQQAGSYRVLHGRQPDTKKGLRNLRSPFHRAAGTSLAQSGLGIAPFHTVKVPLARSTRRSPTLSRQLALAKLRPNLRISTCASSHSPSRTAPR